MPETVNWDLFKSKLENIKPFDGDSNMLNRFIKRCDDLVTKYKTFNDNDLNQHIFECIQEKLIGKAEVMIGRRAELDNWEKLKPALIQCFSDRRDLDCLVQELTRTRPYKNEDLLNFGNRLQILRSNVFQRISNDPTISDNDRKCQFNHYDKTALNTFIAGCSGTMRHNMYIKKPNSLEDAMASVTEFENFEKMFRNSSAFPENKITQKVNNFSHKPPNLSYQNNYNPNFSQNLQHPFNPQFYVRSAWPNQPINVQPRPVVQQRFPTNRQVFGKPQNVFRPNQIPPKLLPLPEPMSTTSRNPTINSNRQNFQTRPPYRNYFQYQNSLYPNQKPTFVSQELYYNEDNENTEIENDPETYYENDNRDSIEYSEKQPFNYYQCDNEVDIAYQNQDTNTSNNEYDYSEKPPNFQEVGPTENQP